MKNKKVIKNRSFFFLISFLFLTSLLSIKTLKKVNMQDIRISGSALISQNDLVNNSSLKFPIRLIFVNPYLIEKELKQNLSLKNVSVNRELFPLGLKVNISTRIPIAYGERIIIKLETEIFCGLIFSVLSQITSSFFHQLVHPFSSPLSI